MNSKSNPLALAVAVAALSLGAAAQAQMLDSMKFTGINLGNNNAATVLNYYNGGLSGAGTTGGTAADYGVAFGTDAEAENSTYSKENFADNPSGASGSSAVLYFGYTSSTSSNYTAYNSMNVAGGFEALSFYYSSTGAYGTAGSGTPSVALYSGLNGTGTLLGTIDLSVNDVSGDGCATGKSYCVWNYASTTLGAGQVAQSAVFSNASEYTYFDTVQIQAVPEPSSFALAAAGLVAVAGLASRTRRRA